MGYAVGHLISCRRKQEDENPERKWSNATRIIGFDGEKVARGMCEGVPVAAATDKIRPCSPSEAL
eukprot:8978257-Karenia_brevis.AAC.1